VTAMEAVPGLPRELAFMPEEYRGRVQKVQRRMRERGLDGLLVHHPPSVNYLTGYQTFNTYDNECAVVPAEGDPVLTVPSMELGGALLHSWLEQPRGFREAEGPTGLLASVLEELHLSRGKLGIEKRSAAVSAAKLEAIQRVLPNADLVDGSGILEAVKTIKSPAEITYLRQAAAITDLGMWAAIRAVEEGKRDNDVAAAAYQAMIGGGSEYMCLDPVVTSGRRSGMLHSTHKRVMLQRSDGVCVEIGACVQRYTAPTMRTISVGEPSEGVARLANACLTAMDNVFKATFPGVTAHEVAIAGWEGMNLAGPGLVFHGCFGYGVGAGFPPTWGDGTGLIMRGVETVLQPGMVFHLPIALRKLGEYATMFSETMLVTETGCESLTTTERRLFVK
jgi:Xaa-Pro dipeptidase